ncbi:MAG TPA: type III pantothenate kinase [Steroidobacteraceae bacterium]|jgi:type III pantothenate kinase|nr:type III pantothenate kinase [Steroidobacteraceae bacterium]
MRRRGRDREDPNRTGEGRRQGLLLLDSGNSRLKWALVRSPYQRRQAFAARGVLELASVHRSAAALARVLRAAGPDVRVHACNVAGERAERQIRLAVSGAGLRAPRFARSAAVAAGVRNGYREAWRLGVDRWVALIGARHEYPGEALCLVGIGSALTIDLLGADGRHHGGSILPGPRMMIESLLSRTAGIRRRAALPAPQLAQALAAAPAAGSPEESLFARDTRMALLSGARHACALLIERAVAQGRVQVGRRVRLIVAGGAADSVAPLLRAAHRRDDDLVLRGLAVLAQGAPSKQPRSP